MNSELADRVLSIYINNKMMPLIVNPQEYAHILEEALTALPPKDLSPEDVALKSLYGLSIIVVSFAEDPLYKELQSMAVLVGADITYPDVTYGQQQWKIDMAEFFKDGSGWRYINGNGTRNGKSVLFPINGPWPTGDNIQERVDVRLRASS